MNKDQQLRQLSPFLRTKNRKYDKIACDRRRKIDERNLNETENS